MSLFRAAALALCLVSTGAGAESVAFVSDLNGRYGSTEYHPRVADAAAAIVDHGATLVVVTGDMIAGQKAGLGADVFEAMWRSFDNAFGARLADAGIPLAVTPGNHDASAFPAFTVDRSEYRRHWWDRRGSLELLPEADWPRRYAARDGRLLLVALDGTVPGRLPADDLAWLERTLQRHGTDAEWTVVFSHLPMWPLARGREPEILEDPELLALLHREGVDVYASGHHHLFFPGLDEAGMLHLGVGALGGNARAFATGGPRQPHGFAEVERVGDALLVHSWLAPAFERGVAPTTMPDHVDGPLGRLTRVSGPVALRN